MKDTLTALVGQAIEGGFNLCELFIAGKEHILGVDNE